MTLAKISLHYILKSSNIYLSGFVSLLAPECAVCFCFCVCVISNQSINKKPYCLSDLNILTPCRKNTQKAPSGTKVPRPRLEICRSKISVSKITHQMLRDHPVSQRNKAIKGAVVVEVGGNGEEKI